MLATFVIGLREGLEAALIVSIVASFLRRNGRSLVPMWIGVGCAVALSLAVGLTLAAVEASLPQAAQEGMESVIGAVAVVFVTSMVLWMATHARGMKRELEASAQGALGDGTSKALTIMAFLAVLKEGFETAVFFLATFQAASSTASAAIGACLGLLAAVVLGWGLYRGTVKLNLAKFFKVTSVFLILVAAGLLVTTLRTAHEAGWLLAGQQRTVDLSWLAPLGSVRGSLFTGVMGIPADPRLVEVVAWVAYVVVMLLLMFWPARHRPSVRTATRIRYAVAAALVLGAAALALTVRTPALATQGPASLVDASGASVGTATVTGSGGSTGDRALVTTLDGVTAQVALPAGSATTLDGVAAEEVTQDLSGASAGSATSSLPATVTASDLVTLTGGRLPVGVDVKRSPGPYSAAWSSSGTRTVWLTDGELLRAEQKSVTTLTISGGGLPSTRTVSIPAGAALPGGTTASRGTWSTDPAYTQGVAAAVSDQRQGATEASFWGRFVPALLLVAAGLVLLVARRRAAAAQAAPAAAPTSPGPAAAAPAPRPPAVPATSGSPNPSSTNPTSTLVKE